MGLWLQHRNEGEFVTVGTFNIPQAKIDQENEEKNQSDADCFL
jgi:hypothetical protein